ncbi:MAG: HD domain-containing protein [Flavipsychrobacter sp.]
MSVKGKIINDPVYGFIRFPEQIILQLIDHPWFQRLRRIKQMGTAHLVYPGAVHTRFQHSLGACHLMGSALDELKIKGVEITEEEKIAAKVAILMHDIGHGPYSHALEHTLVDGITHEHISAMIMQQLNEQFDGALSSAMDVFSHQYPKKYLHQLVSSQLDVDRMDYLNRDSFYTGVSEGVIGYDRILQMLTVKDNELMVEEKGVHSVEKFVIARRLMYWQVYLHKTVLSSEILLINILRRAKFLAQNGTKLFATPALLHFLYNKINANEFRSNTEHITTFCQLDDSDILSAIKVWQNCEDNVLSELCKMLINRRLFKVSLSSQSLDDNYEAKREELRKKLPFNEEELDYFICKGQTSNNTYNTKDERIAIAFKTGETKDISQIDNPIVNQALAMPVHKNYICYVQP